MKKVLAITILLTLLPCAALAKNGLNMGYTIVGGSADPKHWQGFEEGETYISTSGVEQKMVNVEGLLLPVPVSDWYEDEIPVEFQDPARRLFLHHRETGCYISVSYSEIDPEINVNMIFSAIEQEGIFHAPEIIRNPGGFQAVFTRGLTGNEYTLVIPGGGGKTYVVELLLPENPSREAINMMGLQYYDISRHFYPQPEEEK